MYERGKSKSLNSSCFRVRFIATAVYIISLVVGFASRGQSHYLRPLRAQVTPRISFVLCISASNGNTGDPVLVFT